MEAHVLNDDALLKKFPFQGEIVIAGLQPKDQSTLKLKNTSGVAMMIYR